MLDKPHYFTSQPMKRNTRMLLVPVDEREIISSFQDAIRGGKYVWIHVPECVPPIPEDSLVEAVEYDFMTRQFFFRLTHSAFAEVPEGERIPVARVTYRSALRSTVEDAPTVIG